MRRIAGIYNFDQTPVHAEELRRMCSAMDALIPQGQSAWMEGQIGLGAFGIGSSPGEDGNLPQFSHPNGSCVIAFDGRIDNRQELIAALKPRQPVADEGLVLAAYTKWGRDCMARLIGDFAFAIWDCENQMLFCARDHFGVKPFYYYLDSHSFVFASTPRAILASSMVPVKINEGRIADLLLDYEGIDKTISFYEGVLHLPPAHALIVQLQGITLARYWQLTPVVHPSYETEEDYLEQFRELFTEAVRCRLEGNSPPACMLSGGIDSGGIVAVGRKILAEDCGKELYTFSGVSDNLALNKETPHIRAVLEQGGLQPCLIPESRLLERLDELVALIENEDDPFDILMTLPRAVYLHARDRNIHALMDGVDGDILLGRCDYISPLWHSGNIKAAIGETLAANGVAATLESRGGLFFNSLRAAFVPQWMRSLRRANRYRTVVDTEVKDTLINREFAVRSNIKDRLKTYEAQSFLPTSASHMDSHKNAMEHSNLTVGLERYERVANALSIEARHPLLDVRLASFCLSLPWQLKTHRGWTKLILRRAVEPLLPQQVVWRKDTDQLMWIFNQSVLKERVDYFYQLTLDEKDALVPYIDIRKLLNCWRDYRESGKDKDAENIWTGVALALWLRRQRSLPTS